MNGKIQIVGYFYTQQLFLGLVPKNRGLNPPKFNGNSRILKWRYVNVPYVWPYFGAISPYIALKNRPKIYGRYLQWIGSWYGQWYMGGSINIRSLIAGWFMENLNRKWMRTGVPPWKPPAVRFPMSFLWEAIPSHGRCMALAFLRFQYVWCIHPIILLGLCRFPKSSMYP